LRGGRDNLAVGVKKRGGGGENGRGRGGCVGPSKWCSEGTPRSMGGGGRAEGT